MLEGRFTPYIGMAAFSVGMVQAKQALEAKQYTLAAVDFTLAIFSFFTGVYRPLTMPVRGVPNLSYASKRIDLPIAGQKQAGHIPGTPQYANRIKQGKPTSAFFGKKSGDAWTQKAWYEGTPTADPKIKIYDAGVSVGTGPNGGMQTQIRVSIDSQGRIHGTPWRPEI